MKYLEIRVFQKLLLHLLLGDKGDILWGLTHTVNKMQTQQPRLGMHREITQQIPPAIFRVSPGVLWKKLSDIKVVSLKKGKFVWS